jgi:hypothetical protein
LSESSIVPSERLVGSIDRTPLRLRIALGCAIGYDTTLRMPLVKSTASIPRINPREIN